MKLNWLERFYVNSPFRLLAQYAEIRWFNQKRAMDAGRVILEIGCGRGAGARLILEKFQPDQLYLSDLDLRMITMARAYLDNYRRAQMHFLASDATSLPFDNEKFDAVFGFGFLHHVLQWQISLAEIERILKKGGAYYFLEFYPELYQNIITKHLLMHPEFNRFKSRDLHAALEKTNLNLRHFREIKKMGIIGIGIKD